MADPGAALRFAHMRGAIAAGHRLTAEAGAEILAEGGNAVDACLAAAFVSWVAESPLTGPAAGGFLLVHRARDRSDRLLDFFVSVPGQGSKRPPKPHMESIDIDFDATSQVVYLIGAGSCAVPGAVAGLEAAHERYGSLPGAGCLSRDRLGPRGRGADPQQAYSHAILDLILRHAPEGRAIYGESGRLTAGERVVMRDLASTLERLAEGGARELYRGGSAVSSLASRGERGSARADLEDYRVIWRRPSRVSYEGASSSPTRRRRRAES
jgi:gamma-glutamyltranspeptidase/glutathione hydrolase